jgi:hypothetical protein
MALRNYMYFKHEDQLKTKIAHNITNEEPQEQNSQKTSKPKRLTPTQLRKLESLKISEEKQ